MIDALLAKIPADGRIVGPLFWETQAVVSVLADVQRMKAIADGSLSLDLWRENFVPEEARPTDELELVAEEQIPMSVPETETQTVRPTKTDVVEAPIRNESQASDNASDSLDLDSELIRFIKAHRPELKPEPKPNPIPAEPTVSTFSTSEEDVRSDSIAAVIPAALEPEVPPTSRRSSFFF